jgi:excinuclease UvrABC ATPase subunit
VPRQQLKSVTLKLPVGLFVCDRRKDRVSTLINTRFISRSRGTAAVPPSRRRSGDARSEFYDKVISVDQSPIAGHHVPTRYTDCSRRSADLRAGQGGARTRGYGPTSRSTSRAVAARCRATDHRVEMHFHPTLRSVRRRHGQAKPETLEVQYKGNIHDVPHRRSSRRSRSRAGTAGRALRTLLDVGLGYITDVGNHVVGGEAQRVKLALSRRNATPGVRCTFSTSRRRACTSTTSRCCSPCCIACAITGTPWW